MVMLYKLMNVNSNVIGREAPNRKLIRKILMVGFGSQMVHLPRMVH